MNPANPQAYSDSATSAENGEEQARQIFEERFFEEHYRTLKRRARAMLWRDRYATINVTALVHEAWLKIQRSPCAALSAEADGNSGIAIGIACRAMHQFLVDHARRRKSAKRRGEVAPETLIDASAVRVPDPETTLALDAALKKLAHMDERAAQMVMLRYYGGLDWEETGAALGVSPKTLQNEWKSVKAFLLKEMRG